MWVQPVTGRSVEIGFRSAKLQRQCSSQVDMVKTFGPDRAKRLGRRLNELEAAANLEEMRSLPQARCHELAKNRDEQISVDLDQPYRLILEVANEPVPRNGTGGLDWPKITAVTVVEIVDLH